MAIHGENEPIVRIIQMTRLDRAYMRKRIIQMTRLDRANMHDTMVSPIQITTVKHGENEMIVMRVIKEKQTRISLKYLLKILIRALMKWTSESYSRDSDT